jgi:hypothetical protein
MCNLAHTWAERDDVLSAANLVGRHADDAAVCPHALGGCQLGARLGGLEQVQLALREVCVQQNTLADIESMDTQLLKRCYSDSCMGSSIACHQQQPLL